MKSVGVLLSAVIIAFAAANGASQPADPPKLDLALEKKLAAWLQENGKAPADYVIDLFADRDVVFLGEVHRIKHDPLFVQSLLKPLHENGVRVLALEYSRREDQPLIDSLLALSEWDERLAREIIFRQYVMWGYREYVDILRAAWEVNRGLPEGAKRFRVLGINDSPDWNFVETPEDRNDPEVSKKVWKGGGEEYWAGVILDAVRAGEKVLVYCGMHHGFTKYRQPMVEEGRFVRFDPNLRCGNHVYNELGERSATVFLHSPWRSSEGYDGTPIHPADGIIDALMLSLGPRPVGFDIQGSPFGELRIEKGVYRHGYPEFKLSDFCDGWIYTRPISQYEPVTPIEDWITEENLTWARSQCPDPSMRNASPAEFYMRIAFLAMRISRWAALLK